MCEKYSNKNVTFRHLQQADYKKGLFPLLQQLTKSPTPDETQFKIHLQKMTTSDQDHIHVVGVENDKPNHIIAHGSIVICHTLKGKVGKIEDIVTCKSVRGKGYGKDIIEILKVEGKEAGCKIISLYCQEKNVDFYKKIGFSLVGDIYASYTSPEVTSKH